jgi:histidinol-phosphate aminotransferase
MRIGWAYGSAEIADALNRVRNPFNVNAAAQAAAVAALEDVAATDRAREHNDIWLPWLARELGELGLEVNPSVGNFLLVRFPDADAAWSHLQRNGIIVRKMAAYHLPDCLRITIGTEAENRAVVAAVARLLGR